MKQTAIQQAIAELTTTNYDKPHTDYADGYGNALKDAIRVLQQHLPIEQQQIIEAVKFGVKMESGDATIVPYETYYNQNLTYEVSRQSNNPSKQSFS